MWVKGPVGADATYRVTRRACRNVLVMVPTMTAGARLMDLVPLLDGDHRVQTVFTVPHADEAWQYTAEFVSARGGLSLPWNQARQHTWDLVLAASHRHIEQVRGKLLILPHGAGNLMSRRYSRKARGATRPTTGLDAELLVYRGRVLPAVIALTHERELHALRRSCPEALPTAVIAGDICLDRMSASAPYRKQYRAALGIGDNDRLVTISSTWSASSTFGCHPDLYNRLLGEGGVVAAAVLHPMIWAVHGVWQVRSWLAPAIARGLRVIRPDAGWQATMIASDHVIGDHGSTTSYAAAIGRTVSLAAYPEHDIHKGSIADRLARHSPRLDMSKPIVPQLRGGVGRRNDMAKVISSRPGRAASILRTCMYRLLGLPEPSWRPSLCPVPLPSPLWI
ncbi:hypothetical protein [Kibdelosporangium aridum]|nr:hypothetical protein [Kibdelosporangium aridum]